MKIGFLIYGDLDTLSGGYLYDRKLVDSLRQAGDTVEIISLPWRNYLSHLGDNLAFRLPDDLDILIQDELVHPSLIRANTAKHPYPVISLVHHLRASEPYSRLLTFLHRWFETLYLRSVDGFIYNSRTTKGVVEDLIGKDPPHVIGFPPTDRFGEGLNVKAIEERGYSTGPLRILFLGNIIRRKGLHTLLDALSHSKSDLRLDVVGSLVFDPFYAKKMMSIVDKDELFEKVAFHGAKTDKDLEEMLRKAHVLVVPSVYEGFGIVYLEGMSMGLPAIGTTAGAAGEIISDGETGYLIQPGDWESLSATLDQLAEDRGMLVSLAKNALARYKEQPTWEETARNIRKFLLEQMEHNRSFAQKRRE